MRLSPILVREIAQTVAHDLLQAGHANADEAVLIGQITEVLEEDLRLEAEIEDEAKALMRQHRREIRTSRIDTKALFQKLKRELAAKKGRVL